MAQNITGHFDYYNKYHELTVHKSIGSDEGRYRCDVKSTNGTVASDVVYLYLVVPLTKPLTLLDMHGFPMSTATCNDTRRIPLIRVDGLQSFTCEANYTRPRSHINCWCNGTFVLYPEELRVGERLGLKVFHVRRQIDVTWDQCPVLQCFAQTPSPISGKHEKKTVCMKLQRAEVRHEVSCRREYGELGALSKLMCSVSPNTTTVLLVMWYSGQTLQPVFRATPGGDVNDGPIGIFSGRNISGFFDVQNITHTIIIYNSTAADEALYTGVFMIKGSPSQQSQVFLTLVVKPKQLPAILNADGTVISTVKCDDHLSIPKKTITGRDSFLCAVCSCRPKPTTEWIYNGLSRIHEQKYNRSHTSGLDTYSVTRKIDLQEPTNNDISVLKCNVDIPDPRTGSLRRVGICLHIFAGVHHDEKLWLIGLAIPTTMAILIIILVSVLYVRKKSDRALGGSSDSPQRRLMDSEISMSNYRSKPQSGSSHGQENVTGERGTVEASQMANPGSS